MFSVALLLLLAAGSCVKCEQLTQPASVTVQPDHVQYENHLVDLQQHVISTVQL
ncbi:Hypothetical predicted protein [Scomber scombrus]|uniref:Uncharacterized protein n=1 Tax=Scomber scombrus TaxID=13677 RepID=A0AAV1NV90_SCOSC